jgi:dienelactone hydrolase
MNKFGEKLKKWFINTKEKIRSVKPLSDGWKGAIITLMLISIVIYVVQCYYLLASRGTMSFVVGTTIFLLTCVIFCSIVTLIVHFIKKVPSRFLLIFNIAFILLFIGLISPLKATLIVVMTIIMSFSILGAIVNKYKKGRYKDSSKFKKLVAISLALVMTSVIFIGGYWFISDGTTSKINYYDNKDDNAVKYGSEVENPATDGSFKVNTVTYGSENSYREEFNKKDSLKTNSVDGSNFVEKWSFIRKKGFGFGPEKMPINGFVWYPEGEGPFPLIIAVHGNHVASDYSDGGYEYLGKLLASRGYIFASIDENFLNGAPYNDMFMLSSLENENPARGWLMLEHIKVWEQWNKNEGNLFHNKVDVNKIALVGHSRGGEAVSIAAAFNNLKHYPENGTVQFDYGFNIRSIVSIAGTDKQYKPSGKLLPLENINYLAIQGAHDMDVSSFDGASQFNRIKYTNDEDNFKASVYVYGANHGQFNSTWGREDGVGLGNRLYNIKQLISKEDQEQIAKVLISSFLDSTLKGKDEYEKVFQNIKYGKEWLPETLYINNYMNSNTSIIASFEEDIDISTTTIKGGRIMGHNLEKWKEERVKLKFDNGDYNAVRLAWDKDKDSSNASYNVLLPTGGVKITDNSAIAFSLAADDGKGENKSQPIDLTVTVEDKNGNQANLPLSKFSFLNPTIEGKILKDPFASLLPTKEPVFQYFQFKLKDFKTQNPNINIEQVNKISLVFDKSEKGNILLMNLGIEN